MEQGSLNLSEISGPYASQREGAFLTLGQQHGSLSPWTEAGAGQIPELGTIQAGAGIEWQLEPCIQGLAGREAGRHQTLMKQNGLVTSSAESHTHMGTCYLMPKVIRDPGIWGCSVKEVMAIR